MKIESAKLDARGEAFEFTAKPNTDGIGVWVGVKVKGVEYGPQGVIAAGTTPWSFGEGPNWFLVMGEVSGRHGKDGVWYVHFKGFVDMQNLGKGIENFDQDVITVSP